MQKRRQLLHESLAAAFVLLVGAVGCGRRGAKNRAYAPGRAESVAIRFSYQDRVADLVSIVADRKGFFAREGIGVSTSRFSNGPACSEALYSGSADVGTMGDTTAVIAAVRAAPVVIVASHGGGENRHRIIVRKAADIADVSHLVGKRVAVKKGTSTYGGLLAFLAANRLDSSRVKIIDMRPSDMPEALAAGSVDAIVASEPTPSLAEARGGRELATLGGLGSSYPICLVMRKQFLQARPEAAVAFLRAMVTAAAWVNGHPGEAADLLAGATGLSREVAVRAMSYHTFAVGLGPDVMKSLRAAGQFLLKQHAIGRPPDLEAAVDRSVLNKVGGGKEMR